MNSLRSPRNTLYPHKLALTSLTNGGRSVGIVRLRSKATEFSFFFFVQNARYLKMLSSEETLYTLSITEYCNMAIEPTILLALKLTIVHDENEPLLSYIRMFPIVLCNIKRGFQSQRFRNWSVSAIRYNGGKIPILLGKSERTSFDPSPI
jgi:hypothetical protein